MPIVCLAWLHRDRYFRREKVKDRLTQTIHTINLVKDIVPSGLSEEILGTTSSILAIVRVSDEFPYPLPNYMTNDVGQDTIRNREDCGELIEKCDRIGKVVGEVVNRSTTEGNAGPLEELDK